MSLINQVLNDLEKRGAEVGDITGVVRAMPAPGNRRWLVLPLGLLLLVVLAGAAWKMRALRGSSEPASRQAVASVEIASQSKAPPAAPAIAGSEQNKVADLQLSLELASVPKPAVLPGKPTVQGAAKPPQKSAPPMKYVKPQQQAIDEYNHAVALVQQGRREEAIERLDAALHLDTMHEQARQLLVSLLLDARRVDEAMGYLQRGLQRNVKHADFAMLLARLQVERGEVAGALETLGKTLPYAEQRADYRAFMAALMQRMGRHEEAVSHYQAALNVTPNSALWLMGMAISLQEMQRLNEAREAFRGAAQLHTLTPELQAFVERRLKAL